MDTRYPLSALTVQIIAAAHEVHRALGCSFEEVIYQGVLAEELLAHGPEHTWEVWIGIIYKGEKMGRKRVDFVVGMRAAA